MRLLVGFGDNRNLLDAVADNFAGCAIGPGPFRSLPWRAFLVWIGELPELAFEGKGFLLPCQLQYLEAFLEGFAVEQIDFRLIAGRSLHVQLLRHRVAPSRLVTTRHPDDRAPLGQLIQPSNFDRQA